MRSDMGIEQPLFDAPGIGTCTSAGRDQVVEFLEESVVFEAVQPWRNISADRLFVIHFPMHQATKYFCLLGSEENADQGLLMTHTLADVILMHKRAYDSKVPRHKRQPAPQGLCRSHRVPIAMLFKKFTQVPFDEIEEAKAGLGHIPSHLPIVMKYPELRASLPSGHVDTPEGMCCKEEDLFFLLIGMLATRQMSSNQFSGDSKPEGVFRETCIRKDSPYLVRYIGRVPSFDVEVNDYDVNTIFGEAILEAKCNGDDK